MNKKETQKKVYLVTEITHGQEDGELNIKKLLSKDAEAIVTKKATTIMPKEVFNALQMYCTQTDTPKHRALYLFILDGLHAAGQISDNDYQRFRDMAALLTTTYEKK